jgi:hypothetical protein
MKTIDQWTLEDYARHYVETINRPANGWGQHCSDLFGQAHNIMAKSSKLFGNDATQQAIKNLLERKQDVRT